MNITNKIKKKLSQFSYNETISFKELRMSCNEDIKVDSFRKALHRLHKQGIITIHSRGHFVREKEVFKTYLFVYGSLKKGFENDMVLENVNYVSKAKTVKKFAMYQEESQNYPYIIKDENRGQNIEGELYLVTRKEILKKIDEFESASTYFNRTDIFVQTRSKKVKAKTYVLANPKTPLNQKPLKSWVEKRVKLDIDFDAYFQHILG